MQGLVLRRLPGVAALACLSLVTLSACPAQTRRDAPVAAVPAAAAVQAKPLPPGGVSALPADPLGAFNLGGATANATLERVPVEGQPFKQAVRLTTKARTPDLWGVQFTAAPTVAVKKGDTLLLTFYARTVKGQSETGEARTQFVFERGAEPYDKAVTYDVSIPAPRAGWKRYDVPFKAQDDLGTDVAKLHFRLGYDPQSWELGGVSLTKWGPEVALSDLPRTAGSYAGMEADAAWRKDALARIERIRKGDLTVKAVDAGGKAVPNAQVAVRMKRHAFPFGSAVAAEQLLAEGPDGDRYREFVTKNFNRVVMENDLKWADWERNRDRAKRGVAWLRGRGIAVRGHNLVWPGWRWLPADLPNLKGDKAALRKRVADHIAEEAGAMRGLLVDWDVINEPFANHDIQDILGNDILVEWFKLARQADPDAVLYLNDYPPLDGGDPNNPHLNHFEKTLRYLKEKGAPLGGIGFQGHFGGNVIPPARVLSGLDRFGKLGLPIAITEFDINTTDAALQAQYMRDFMTAAFSHPSVSQIIMWGFWEGRHWLPDAALVRRDWTVKPVGQAWLDMVHKEWRTSADGTTGRGGEYRTRGFLGDYEITVTANGKTKTVPTKLARGGASVTVKLD